FFFQAEDGIRDKLVTGVQTCALPIWLLLPPVVVGGHVDGALVDPGEQLHGQRAQTAFGVVVDETAGEERVIIAVDADRIDLGRRSEERRVGKESRTRGAGDA